MGQSVPTKATVELQLFIVSLSERFIVSLSEGDKLSLLGRTQGRILECLSLGGCGLRIAWRLRRS